MNIKTLTSKLHCAICTESRLDYIGSVTIVQDWMDEAGLQNNQVVDVLNLENGARITTYTISGKRGNGEICLNGAAAHHFEPGHKVIIIAYCDLTLDEKNILNPKLFYSMTIPLLKLMLKIISFNGFKNDRSILYSQKKYPQKLMRVSLNPLKNMKRKN